jgi:hypothetical protein
MGFWTSEDLSFFSEYAELGIYMQLTGYRSKEPIPANITLFLMLVIIHY